MPLKISDISTLPQVDEAINGWEVSLLANQKQQTIVDGDVIYNDIYIKISAVVQPFKTEDLLLKDEASRNFAWFWLHIKASYPKLYVNQQVFIKNKPYKIMGVKDYSLNGFIEYEMIADYQQQ